MVRETLPVLQRFVEHHQRVGAEHVFLYFDGTEEETRPIREAFAGDSSVSVDCCDSNYWDKMYPGKEQIDLGDKQIGAFRDGLTRNTSDWILICDADEFVVSDEPLGVALAQLPEDFKGVRIRNTEAVWGPGGDIHNEFSCEYERHPFPTGYLGNTLLPILVYGRDWFMIRRGVTGYKEGKHLLRKGMIPEELTSHSSVFGGKRVRFMPPGIARGINLRIVHFDAIGYERWETKWATRISGRTIPRTKAPMRLKQWALIEEALSAGRGESLFRRMSALNFWQAFVLNRLGLLTRIKK
ncbi:glycosyltransferase family 2 protein [Aliiroseovarius sp. S253]|uniref:glycosyltransferase family 2 protein n=1 Tax=Aliiroseovarius sp. S253 TaxID=3415133 RepID=UPI003C7E6FA9